MKTSTDKAVQHRQGKKLKKMLEVGKPFTFMGINIVKMSTLSKAIYLINAILNNIIHRIRKKNPNLHIEGLKIPK